MQIAFITVATLVGVVAVALIIDLVWDLRGHRRAKNELEQARAWHNVDIGLHSHSGWDLDPIYRSRSQDRTR